MSFKLPKFTEPETEDILTLFITGSQRIEVVDYLLENNDKIKVASQDYDEKAFRKLLSDQLRSLDPTSTKFAKGKYYSEYEDALKGHKSWLSRIYDSRIVQSVEILEKELESATAHIQKVEARLETETLTIDEFVKLCNLLQKLKQDKRALHDKYLERLERIHQQTIAF